MSRIAPIPETPIPPRTPRGSPLGLLFENALVRFIVDVFNRVKSAAGETLRYAVERTLEALEPAAIDILRPVITKAFESPDLPPEVRALGTQLLSGEHQIELAMLIPIGIGLVVGVVSGAFRPFSMVAQYFMDRQIQSARLDPGTAIRAIWRSPELYNLARGDLSDMGWSDERISAIVTVAEERLGLGELLILWRRGNISEQELVQQAAQLGFRPDKVQDFKDATELIPGPADLVRFALREAWRDDIAERWGYDQGLVPEFGEWMRKQGLSADWAKRYWRSHWVVPTWGQGLEMWWRAEISESELIDLLKVNDIAPGWIPHLMAIARPVPGRIDRRWAFQEGEITEDELYQLYRMDGYDDRWATILANTVIKRAVSEAKGLTRAAIEKAYRKRRLSQDEAIGMLSDIGIQEMIARFYLSQADADRADDLLDRRITVVGRRFLDGDLRESEVRDQLVALGVSGEEIDVYLEEWNITRAGKLRRPTRTNLDKFFQEGVIGIDEYRDQMDRLGYSSLYIDWYLAALAIARQQILEKEEKEARVEQERIDKYRRKTDYQVAKAIMDVNIAELQAAIAGTQVALVEAENERDRQLLLALPTTVIVALEREYQPLLFEAEAVISEVRLQITSLQTLIKAKQELISLVDRSLIENVDMTRYASLRAQRLHAQTQQALLGELIAAGKVAIAETEESMAYLTEPEDFLIAERRVLALKTDIALNQEVQAQFLTAIEEIDEAMAETLAPIRRQELQTEKATYVTDIAVLQTEVGILRGGIQAAQSEKEGLARELETRITALPGREAQIAIRAEYQTLIAQLQGFIKEMRESVAQLRVSKAQLLAGYRVVE